MTDKELLELAAKAAGLLYITPADGYDGSFGLVLSDEHERHVGSWNPLTDDGDAFRLAVKLDIVVWEFSQYQRAIVEVRYGKASGEYFEPGEDRYSATRRAIVRAAAAIGKETE